MNWRVEIHQKAEQELGRIPEPAQSRIINKLLSLGQDPFPFGAIKLKGHDGYRLRVGDYRILYEAEPSLKIVTIFAIGHRKEVYR